MYLKKLKLLSIYSICLLLLTNCSFNKAFLQPDKISKETKCLPLFTFKDSTYVFFSGNNFQPTFIKKNNDTISFEYTIESIVFKSKNGNNINAWFLKPKNIEADYTILHLHGNAGSLQGHFQIIAPLCKYGFQILMFDYSGFGFSEGISTRENVLIDAHSALDYLKSRPEVSNTKLFIYGQSLGGHLSAVLADQRQSEIDGLVIEGAFSSHSDIGSYHFPIIGRIFIKSGYSAKKSIKYYHKPVLIIHSTEDIIIPFKMGEKLYKRANEPKKFFEVKKYHICAPIYYPAEISEKIRNLKIY